MADNRDTCPECGDDMDQDCMGEPRCPTCDPPCPHCDDGGMDAQDEPSEPEEGDYTTEDHIHFYQDGKLVLTFIADESDGTLADALHEHMESEQYWPNVWFISDHGNTHLIDLTVSE